VVEVERAVYGLISDSFARMKLRFGVMETPNMSNALSSARCEWSKFEVITKTFFLGCCRFVPGVRAGQPLILDRIYVALSHVAAAPSDIYHLPRDRAVEFSARIAV
jgi:KUP system potassium uptake protein